MLQYVRLGQEENPLVLEGYHQQMKVCLFGFFNRVEITAHFQWIPIVDNKPNFLIACPPLRSISFEYILTEIDTK